MFMIYALWTLKVFIFYGLLLLGAGWGYFCSMKLVLTDQLQSLSPIFTANYEVIEGKQIRVLKFSRCPLIHLKIQRNKNKSNKTIIQRIRNEDIKTNN